MTTAANRRLTVTLSVSLIVHAVALGTLAWMLSRNVEPSAAERLLVLTLRSDRSDEAVSNDADRDADTPRRAATEPASALPDARREPPVAVALAEPLSPTHEPPVPTPEPEAVMRVDDVPPQQPVVEALAPRPEPPPPMQAQEHAHDPAPDPAPSAAATASFANDVPIPAPDDAPAGADAEPVQATPDSNRRVQVAGVTQAAPPPARIAMSPGEHRTVRDRLRDWSETLSRMKDADPTRRFRVRNQEYVARFRRVPAASNVELDKVVVELSTMRDGVALTAELTMKKLAFSNFAQFVHRWDPQVQLHDDEMDGRFHSNSVINVAYDRKVRPSFLGKVTTASRRVNYADSRVRRQRDDIFRGGLETGVRRILLPGRYLPFPDGIEPDDQVVHRFDEHTRIRFYADGSFGASAIDADGEIRHRIGNAPVYLIAAAKKRLHVSGTVDGSVLVYSPQRIVIEGDLVYAHEPGADRAADDFLGLVSDKSVVIAGPNVTGHGDLSIHAAIYAKRRFAIDAYRSRDHAVLYLFGSLTVGSLTATEPRFATRIEFDKRLEALRPPGFPISDRYEVESWDAVWHVAEAGDATQQSAADAAVGAAAATQNP